MSVLAPGSILQRLYLKRRLKVWRKRDFSFLDIGSGVGYISNTLLRHGGHGIGIDLNTTACAENAETNSKFIKASQYIILNEDFLDFNPPKKFDVIISMMVIEHLPHDELKAFIEKSKSLMNADGSLIFYVPAGSRYWGIEDEIAGHQKRYEFSDFDELAKEYGFQIKDMAGLTYPMSNVLFRLSNYLISKSESHKLDLSVKEKTVLSGKRDVQFKTKFPSFFIIFLNEYTLRPFHWLQLIFKRNSGSMVIYCELGK